MNEQIERNKNKNTPLLQRAVHRLGGVASKAFNKINEFDQRADLELHPWRQRREEYNNRFVLRDQSRIQEILAALPEGVGTDLRDKLIIAERLESMERLAAAGALPVEGASNQALEALGLEVEPLLVGSGTRLVKLPNGWKYGLAPEQPHIDDYALANITDPGGLPRLWVGWNDSALSNKPARGIVAFPVRESSMPVSEVLLEAIIARSPDKS